MSVAERDEHTGQMTTGHEWNGIQELNTSVPRVVWVFLVLTLLFSVGYWILLPAWPTVDSATRGLLKTNQQTQVANALTQASDSRALWEEQLLLASHAQVQRDPELMDIVMQTGPRLFGDNCAACHGRAGQGRPGYPRLNDESWLWDNGPDQIEITLAYGINSTHAKSRVAMMPSFGSNGALDSKAILDVAGYVQSMSRPAGQQDARQTPESLKAGKQTFSTLCIACHGVDAKGNQALGAPNLTDTAWIYGDDIKTIRQSIAAGRAGHMPAWENRLSVLERKVLTLYLLTLSQTQVTRESE